MSEGIRQTQIARVLLALIAAPLVATVIYTLITFGPKLFFPFAFFVAGTAFALTLLLFVPAYLLLLWKQWLSLPSIIATSFFLALAVFLVAFVGMDQGFTSIRAGNRELIVDGRVTSAGYVSAVVSALTVASVAAIGGLIFWFIVYFRRKP